MVKVAKPVAQVGDEEIKAASIRLKELPKKPREGQTLREIINTLRSEINGALAKGYSYAEVTAILKEQGITIAPSTLKQYVSEARLKAIRGGSERKSKVKGEVKQKSGEKQVALEQGKLSKGQDVSGEFNQY